MISAGERGSLAVREVRHLRHPSRLSEGGQYAQPDVDLRQYQSSTVLQYCNAHVSLRRQFSLTLSNCRRSQSRLFTLLTAPLCAAGEHKPFVSHTSRTSFSEHRPFLSWPLLTVLCQHLQYFLTLLPHCRASLSRWKRYVPNLANHAAIQVLTIPPIPDPAATLPRASLTLSPFLDLAQQPSIVGCFLTLAGHSIMHRSQP